MRRVVAESRGQHREHLVGAAARGADDEDVAERLFVPSIALGERIEDVIRRAVDSRLLASREGMSRRKPLSQGLAIADLRVMGERLAPVVFGRARPTRGARPRAATRGCRTAAVRASDRPTATIRRRRVSNRRASSGAARSISCHVSIDAQPADAAIRKDVEPHVRDGPGRRQLLREEVPVMGLESRAAAGSRSRSPSPERAATRSAPGTLRATRSPDSCP